MVWRAVRYAESVPIVDLPRWHCELECGHRVVVGDTDAPIEVDCLQCDAIEVDSV
jgi:hypothetical protein